MTKDLSKRPDQIRIPLSKATTKAIHEATERYQVPVRSIIENRVNNFVEGNIETILKDHFSRLFSATS